MSQERSQKSASAVTTSCQRKKARVDSRRVCRLFPTQKTRYYLGGRPIKRFPFVISSLSALSRIYTASYSANKTMNVGTDLRRKTDYSLKVASESSFLERVRRIFHPKFNYHSVGRQNSQYSALYFRRIDIISRCCVSVCDLSQFQIN